MTDNNHTLPTEGSSIPPAFKEDLTIEVLARFTGNSRGTPIARREFINGSNWTYERHCLPLQQQLQTVQQENERQREKIIEISAPGWQQAFKRVEELKAERDKISATVKELTEALREARSYIEGSIIGQLILNGEDDTEPQMRKAVDNDETIKRIDAALSRTQEHD